MHVHQYSLKSLPTATGAETAGNDMSSKANSKVLDLDLVTRSAKWLSNRLGLTIFGFDVVVSLNILILIFLLHRQL